MSLKNKSFLALDSDVLVTLDLLDLDEDLVDNKLKKIINKNAFLMTTSDLKCALACLKYKYLICLREETDCDNDVYVNFCLKFLISTQDEELRHALVSEMLTTSLLLSQEKIKNYIEHIIQQLLNCEDFQNTLLNSGILLKVINRVLEICVNQNITLFPLFLNNTIESILEKPNEYITLEFYSNTIPLIMKACNDYNILNIIWSKISDNMDKVEKKDFLVLCTLSEFYLPLTSDERTVKSNIYKKIEFWEFLQHGFLNDDPLIRKCSLFLARRAVSICEEKMVTILNENSLFHWNKKESGILKVAWDSFFIFIETLEEKQSELVLSSLKLIDSIMGLHSVWYHTALTRALSHNTNLVVLNVLKIALSKNSFQEGFPYCKLLEALNNTYICANFQDDEINSLKMAFENILNNETVLINVMKNLSVVKLSPVPSYYLYSVIRNLKLETLIEINLTMFLQYFCLENVPSNNALFDNAKKSHIIDFIINHKLVNKLEDLLNVVNTVNNDNTVVHIGNILWYKLLQLVKSVNHLHEKDFDFGLLWLNSIQTNVSHQSLTIFALLLVYEGVTTLSDLKTSLNHLIQQIKSHQCSYTNICDQECEKKMLIIGYVVNEIYNHRCEKLITHDIGNFFSERNNEFIEYICNKMEQLNNTTDDIQPAFLYYLKMLSKHLAPEMFVINYADIGIKARHDSSAENGLMKKYCSIEISSYFVKSMFNCKTCSNTEKYQYIQLFFHAFQCNVLHKECDRTIIHSKINKNKMMIYSYNYMCLDVWDSEQKHAVYTDIIHFLQTSNCDSLHYMIDLSRALLQKQFSSLHTSEVELLIDIIWKEIFAVRKSNRFSNLMKNFIRMICYKEVLENSSWNNIYFKYFKKVHEFSDQVPSVMYEFIKQVRASENYVTPEILLKGLTFGNPLRKDERIELDIRTEILSHNEGSDCHVMKEDLYPVYNVRMMLLCILLKQNVHAQLALLTNLMSEVDSVYKPEHRYHCNSLHHRMLLRTMQTIITLFVVTKDSEIMSLCSIWCVQRLKSQPHHTSSKIYLEWLISLYIIYNEISVRDVNSQITFLIEIPQISYFTIMFHVMKYRLKKAFNNNDTGCLDQNLKDDVDFVLNTFLPYTMGQLFSMRLHVQYYTMRLLEIIKDRSLNMKYDIFLDAIKKTFNLNKSDDSLNRIYKDFYINSFDIIESLSLNNLFNCILQLTNVSQDECIPLNVLAEYEIYFPDMADNLLYCRDSNQTKNSEVQSEIFNSQSILSKNESNIQKKFVPWKKFLADVGILQYKNKESCSNDMIVVASLIDRLPNLGGLSRTCEIFGVKKYIISSLQHLQDKQFQSMSMSSEKLLDIEEKLPGKYLKEYLMEMKSNGYTIIAAEQTSCSIPLSTLKFPKKSLLLVGHEKHGVPSDLICLMDYCVEIPQHGMVRSLNVHVTASIFIWEYMKQQSY